MLIELAVGVSRIIKKLIDKYECKRNYDKGKFDLLTYFTLFSYVLTLFRFAACARNKNFETIFWLKMLKSKVDSCFERVLIYIYIAVKIYIYFFKDTSLTIIITDYRGNDIWIV